MNFFNFELAEDSYYKESIKLPEDFKRKLPEDYVEFLTKYDYIDPKRGGGVDIKIGDYEAPVSLYNYNNIKKLSFAFPKCFTPIAADYQYEGFIMSLRKEDYGYIYYMNLEMYWKYVMDKEAEEEQINGVLNNAFLLGKNFTEFTHKLYDSD